MKRRRRKRPEWLPPPPPSWVNKPRRKKGYVIVLTAAPEPCPRCRVPMQVREHAAITEEHLAQPYYYTRWFRCMNASCKTTLVMREEFRVMKAGETA